MQAVLSVRCIKENIKWLIVISQVLSKLKSSLYVSPNMEKSTVCHLNRLFGKKTRFPKHIVKTQCYLHLTRAR